MADITQTAANVRALTGALLGEGTAGETVVPGDFLYRDATDLNHLKKLINDSAAHAACVGMSISYGDDGDKISFAEAGPVDVGGTLVKGRAYVASDNAGKLRPESDNASGDFATVLGIALDTDQLQIDVNASGIAFT